MKKIKFIFLIIIISLVVCACESSNDKEILIELNTLSNKFYTKEIEGFRQFFESKIKEEPKKYKETYHKITNIETEVAKYKKLKTMADKKELLNSFTIKFKSLLNKNTIVFVSNKNPINNPLIFNSVLENDLNRFLYVMYKKFYNYHYSVF